ncbi:hypothetical protein ATCV1_z273L [Acanthocystis turfacea chlorella virus 1]|uniref:Uncharacterized protein z273L n=1 Tax=Chlorovirus heliozoae TaxID=322019 RepID=A7K8N3_9PHYC|nr:hypothetical protein ATCV1_z273L [Acanthocystis turfacea chlorella virus 1]ABT16407.1 hypothetical protein ATCV1_z273L [Acanthocystis turfacea chlorella virus 1]
MKSIFYLFVRRNSPRIIKTQRYSFYVVVYSCVRDTEQISTYHTQGSLGNTKVHMLDPMYGIFYLLRGSGTRTFWRSV